MEHFFFHGNELEKPGDENQMDDNPFKKAFNHAPHARLLLETDGKNLSIIDVNVKFQEDLGQPKKEIIVRGAKYLFKGDTRIQHALKSCHEFARMKKTNYKTHHVHIKDAFLPGMDDKYTIEMTCIDGSLISILLLPGTSLAANVTKRESSHFKLLDTLPGVAFRCKLAQGWPLIFASKGHEKLTGYSASMLHDNPDLFFKNLVHPDDEKRVYQEIKSGLQQEKVYHVEYRIVARSGEVRWVSEWGTLVLPENGLGIFDGLALDISIAHESIRELEQRERDYQEAFNQANFYRDLFTHDMNNILQAMLSILNLCRLKMDKNEMDMDTVENYCTKLEMNMDRAARLIRNVRKLSLLERDDLELSSRDILSDLKRCIEYTRDTFKSVLNLEISLVSELEKAPVRCNELIEDIFDNLINNAIVHNRNDIREVIVKVCKQEGIEKDHVRVEIIDNGKGISDERKDIIFNRRKGKSSQTRGKGIGLSLVQGIVELFNARIWVEDRVDGNPTAGARFVILFPLAG